MKGYSSNAWLTFKQAQALGGSVRKGETSTRCIYVGMSTVEKEQNSTKEDQWFSFQKVYSLFNIEQVDGVDLTSGNEEPLPDVNPCTLLDDSSDALLQAYCVCGGGGEQQPTEKSHFENVPTEIISPVSHANT